VISPIWLARPRARTVAARSRTHADRGKLGSHPRDDRELRRVTRNGFVALGASAAFLRERACNVDDFAQVDAALALHARLPPMRERTFGAAWIPVALCLLITAASSAYVGHAEQQAERARFANHVDAVRDHINERMASYMGVLRGAAGLVAGTTQLTPDEFRVFVEHLELRAHYPGTQGIGYTARFGAVSAAEATARARAAGWTNVRVWPETPRDDVHAIVMLEPLDARNRAALGYDMRTEPTRREAMDRARDHGDVAMSGKVTLVQEIERQKQAGFLLYAPVYLGGVVPASIEERRAKLVGYVYMPLRAGDLFEGIFGQERPSVAYELYDGAVGDATRLYRFGRAFAPDERVVVEPIAIGGHAWTARFVPASASPVACVAAVQVAALGVLLSVVVFFVTRARERAREREVRARAAALASEESLRLKEMFVGILGHDLMNPLNAIGLTTELLSRRVASDERALAMVSRIRSSSTRMTRMIEQILDLTRARLGEGIRIDARALELGPLVQDVVDEVVRAHPDGLVEVDTRGDVHGTWDPDRLAQVIANLVGNAVRYRRDAPVRVTLDGTAPERVVVKVHNAGVIPAVLLPVVFEPFRGSGASPRRTAGLGLGLYITRAIVLAHGGAIDVTSCEGEGTTFTVSLPREPRPAAGAAPTPESSHRVIGAGPRGEVREPPPRELTGVQA